jgi:integrase
VRRGKGGRCREVGMDAWGWEHLEPRLTLRRELPVGPLLCVTLVARRGAHRAATHRRCGRSATALRGSISSATRTRSRWARDGVRLIVIQRQLGHSNLGITSVYLQGIDSGEIIKTVHARRAPVVAVSASLRL